MLNQRWASALVLTLTAFSIMTTLPAVADPAASLNSARAAMELKDWSTANYEWRQVLVAAPDHIEAKVGLAQSLFNTNFYDESISILESIPENKRPLVASLGLARTYAATKDYLKSRNVYIEILKKDPYQANAFLELKALEPKLPPAERKALESSLFKVANMAKVKGNQALEKAQYKDAARYYEVAAAQLKTVGLVNDYGIILLLAGQYDEAHQQFLLLRNKNKMGFSEVNSNASIASLSVGKLAEAKKEILDAIQQAPTDKLKAELYNNMGFILEMSGKRTDAKFAYLHALDLDPQLGTARKNLAFVLQANQEYDEAIKQYQQILKRTPQDVELWNRLGFVYELQYKSRPALSAYKNAIQAAPKYKDSYYNLAMLYKKMNRFKDANNTLQRYMEISYAEIEAAPKVASEPVPQGAAAEKNPLKYVVLFPSNPNVVSKLQ
jgi:tetratricopeptide (TPR) repeat protein